MPERSRDVDIPKTKAYDQHPVLIDDVVETFVNGEFLPPKVPMYWGPLQKDKFKQEQPLNIPKIARFLFSAAPYNSDFFVWNLFG